MKKLFTLLLLFSIIHTFAQNLKWDSVNELEEKIFNTSLGVSGEYIGDVSGFQYYIYHHPKNQFIINEEIVFSIIKVQNNKVIQSTEFFDKKYNLLKITLINSKICVLFIDDSDKNTPTVKIDYYDPNTLIFEKTSILYSFKTIEKNISLKKIVFSEDRSKFAILSPAINPKNDRGCLLFKAFDIQLNPIFESYFSVDFEGANTLGDFLISNEGIIYFNINNFHATDDVDIFKNIYFNKVSTDEIRTVKYEIPSDFTFQDMKFTSGINQQGYVRFLITEKEKITFYALDFSTEEISDVIHFETPVGFWKIEKWNTFKNGNSVLLLADKGITFYSSQAGQTYVYWNRNLLALHFNESGNDLIKQDTIFRHFVDYERFKSVEGNLKSSLFFIPTDHSISFLYNTNPKVNKDNSSTFYDRVGTPKPITKMCTISDDGEITNSLVFNSEQEGGVFIPSFSFIHSDLSINICKSFKKKIVFGNFNF